VFVAYNPDWYNRDAYVSFLDVGQGDAIFIRTAHGKHILIDGGGSVVFRKPGEQWRERNDPFEVGRKVVVPLLLKRGVQAIDLLVVSHLDSDHIKGLNAVLSSIPVKRILWNGTVKPSGDALTLLESALKQGIPLYRADAGLSWKMDDETLIHIIGSPPTANSSTAVPVVEEQNGRSVAMLVHLYARTFLLTGDADAAEEHSILSHLASQTAKPEQQQKQQHSPVDVLKVSHHGSKTSSTPEWLSYWHPAAAVISVGRSNLYGHPNTAVLERLKKANAEVKRTDLHGEVQFRITPENEMYVRHMLPGDKSKR
jgi:competence protein ComEC